MRARITLIDDCLYTPYMILGVVVLGFLVFVGAGAHAQTDVSILGNSILTEFTNVYDADIDRIAVWFTTDHTIQSHAVVSGWDVVSDEQTLQMVNGILEQGQSVKVGLKFQGEDANIAWLMASGDDILEQGWILQEEVGEVVGDEIVVNVIGILPESSFHTVPTKPTVGATIRVVGTGFAPNHSLELLIQDSSVDSFMTDSDGGFVTTLTLPENLEDRIEFVIVDGRGNESHPLSLRLDVAPDLHADATLAITSISETFSLGDFLDISGTGRLNSVIVATLINPEQDMISSIPIKVNQEGLWSLSDSMVIPLNSDFGEYTINISDGVSAVSSTWTVEPGTNIAVKAMRSAFEPGQVLKFEGEAMPNTDLTLILQDPNGNEVIIDTIQVGSDGSVEWEYPTQNNSLLGTYMLILTQGSERHITYAGLGSEVEEPIWLIFDQPNYLHSDRPKVTVENVPNEVITFLVASPTDSIVYRDSIELQSNGRAIYEMDIQNFTTGVYTAIAQKGTAQSSYRFGVGLSMSASVVKIDTTRDIYSPGEQVQLLGTATPDSIIRITLLDPDGSIVHTIDTFSDRTGRVAERHIRIPQNAINGDWSIKMSSGSTSDIVTVAVNDVQQNNLSVSVESTGQSADIVVSGASGMYVYISILNGDILIEEPIRAYTTDGGKATSPWTIKISGTYTIVVEDGAETAQTIYDYERN
ncbi:MAG: hypothetical protein F4Y82_03780 [Cenarchaeum sp. SB0665_bin_23]|nr:hypothetical protein [Cenarchaeum sp. SB0667_bin_13]MXY37762.1 hypothetical protein [Cenarchaeum sp. SB0664_bin_35]MXY61221.1 hypothetical protein [Cenarchaeum sp. SB0665_bin_23]MYB46150.1 hypothetical protein [Cenarchaeum sp. SB0662_bin_33]MYC79125.1 hypothetical protein [Cenarchaeum sp. SB0661_bin_35]MYI51821.1 hypothetical protein [Cenarchaeum sp. SB0673_bin_9]